MAKKAKDSGLALPTPDEERILREQVFDDLHPGPVVYDFDSLLSLIGPKGIQVSDKNGFFPLSSVKAINERMSRPIQVKLGRTQQKAYSNIHGLYLLLRATGIGLIEKKGSKKILKLDEAMLQSWKDFNPTERYMSLLESWLFRGFSEILGERSLLGNIPTMVILDFLENIPEKGMNLKGGRPEDSFISYQPGWHVVALMDLFGVVSVKSAEPAEGNGWRVTRIDRTPFGDALSKLLEAKLLAPRLPAEPSPSDEELDDSPFIWEIEGDLVEKSFGKLQPLLQPYFPEWRRALQLPEGDEFREGVHIFKVSLDKAWRRIAIPGGNFMQALSQAILIAFDFDDDHLYSFIFEDRFGMEARINHPYMDDQPPWVDEIKVGAAPLKPGMSMTFLFDFGDEWEFEVTLEEVGPVDRRIKKPKLLEAHGKAPVQYQSWEEDDEEEEEEY